MQVSLVIPVYNSENILPKLVEQINKNLDLEFEIISRSDIQSKKTGPMIIVESTAITYVDINYDVNLDGKNNLVLTNREMN